MYQSILRDILKIILVVVSETQQAVFDPPGTIDNTVADTNKPGIIFKYEILIL